MSLSVFFLALTTGILAIAGLVLLIIRLLKKNHERKQTLEEAERRLLEGRAQRIESIRVLLKVVGTEELGWIEASIRVKVLLDQLSFDLSAHEDIGVFYRVYAETEHIPTHESWNELPMKAKRKFRAQMEQCEEQHLNALKRGQKALSNFPLV
ncbi:DUF2489 domain-containing protein [Marinomonas sp. 15G1-11]|mgnify:CR=1 FL=1|uniref:DUF2489 domain-containing protein n=1 Tax=Marinomonas phaeophyticola TaxID=3004091 RepID=A0ABT4JUV6_9GAMM|nr:DUF2489 domain-containing protein [Marinomonas sp. 15G1-11]MCZ2722134.1 DUF2489 domain-containing protein [Marinomonas sp. 15G1-11]